MVKLFLDWLTASVPISQLWLYIAGAVILTFAWDYTVIATAFVFHVIKFYDARVSKITSSYLIGLFFWVFIEEVIYRFPLAILIVFGLRTVPVLIAAAIFSFLVFGIVHRKSVSVIVQGGDGFLWCLLFLKCGGLQGNYFQALLVTTLVHFVCNFIITCPIPRAKKYN